MRKITKLLKMGRINVYLCQAAFLLLLIACTDKNSDEQRLPIAADYLKIQFSSFSDDSTIFVKAFTRAGMDNHGSKSSSDNRPIQAGIIAHHLLISDLIAEYFLKISINTNPKRIILMGPNHRSRGEIPISTSLLPWKTPFGVVKPHRSMIKAMISHGVAGINDDAFFMEHSIGALVPFIRRVFPQAQIVPLVLLSNTSVGDCDQLSDWLAKHLDNETLLLASIDFSHYKTSAEAECEDSISLPIIQQLDYERANNAFVCSRPTLRVLLRTLKMMGYSGGEVVHHTNSGIRFNQLQQPCTSYINMIWSQLPNHHHNKVEQDQKQITFLFGGDILLHPSIARSCYSKRNKKYDFDGLFAPITDLRKSADVVVANLEGTFAGESSEISFFPRHNYPDELAFALSNAGFSTISLANNHAADTGCSGLMRTCNVLLDNGIQPIGLQSKRNLTLNKFRNVKYSILAYSYGTNFPLSNDCAIRPSLLDFEVINNDIVRSRKAGAQIVIIFLHCGNEYQFEIEPGLKTLAHQIANAGADAIICTHLHVIRPWEWIQIDARRVFIHYSLGNLLSSHSDSLYNQGELALLSFEKFKQDFYIKNIQVIKVRTKFASEGRLYLSECQKIQNPQIKIE